MKDKAGLYRVAFFISIIMDVMFFFLALICVICRIGNLFEWLIMIFVDMTLGIPTNIILYQRIRKYETQKNFRFLNDRQN